jgi:hypothetical protein
MGAEDDIKGILGVASQLCFLGTVAATAMSAHGHWMRANCRACGGARKMRCEHCRGRGKLTKPTARGDFSDINAKIGEFPCMFCSGSGAVTCRACAGAGSEIGERLNWTRMARPLASFDEIRRARAFGLVPNPIHALVILNAKEDALDEFVHSDLDDLDVVTKKLARRRARAAARRAAKERARARRAPPSAGASPSSA